MQNFLMYCNTIGLPKVVPPTPPPAPSLPAPPPAPPPPPVHKFCDSNPCVNGATCLEALATYFCQCPENKFGKNCDQTPKVIGMNSDAVALLQRFACKHKTQTFSRVFFRLQHQTTGWRWKGDCY